MIKSLAAATLGALLALSLPAFAEESAACQQSWKKLDANNRGYVMYVDAEGHLAKMKKANLQSATEDRMTAKEYADACKAGVFGTDQR
jgi:hypothetical protein